MHKQEATHVLSHTTLREHIIESLKGQGFKHTKGTLTPPPFDDKEVARLRHQPALQLARSRAEEGLRRHEGKLLSRFASGREVDPAEFEPRLVEVHAESFDELLFRYARLHWSIPISAGYGRRLRFLILDASNGKLVGIIGLGDPVFALGPRDRWIGWSREVAKHNLHNVMDAFVLGAVPPYSYLLAGKLAALLAASDEVRAAYSKKYGTGVSRIAQRPLHSRLLLITTTSALGRSSIYNRLRYQRRDVFQRVGFTLGSGEFHFSNGLYADIRRFAERHCTPTAKQTAWGSGFRNRREVIRKALIELGLSGDWLYHGLEREVFAVPTAANTCALLRGEQSRARWFHLGATDLGSWFKERWMLPRADRDQRYRLFDPKDLELWPKIDPVAERRYA